MKKRWIAVMLLAVLMVVIGCAVGAMGTRQETEENRYKLYFVERNLADSDGGDALQAEERLLRGLEPTATTEETARRLVAELLRGPADAALVSPFPRGTVLLSVEQQGTEIRVDLSSGYAALSGIDLSLADYAITMTLIQLPDVARVRITVGGRELDYRSRQIFLERDILFAPQEDVVGTVKVQLYFEDEDGTLTQEDRVLNLYEGDTQVGAVVRALENGPESKGLQAVIPEGFKVRKVWLEEGVCYVSLSSALLEGQPDAAALSAAIDALRQSLLTLDSVETVRFLVDGEFAETYGPVELPAD